MRGAIAKQVGVKNIYDLSATPFYLSGSGHQEGFIFPWTVSDFSLMDAIESGIVKIPRTPVDDDSTDKLVTYLRLWDFIGDKLPKKKMASMAGTVVWVGPPASTATPPSAAPRVNATALVHRRSDSSAASSDALSSSAQASSRRQAA